MSICGKFITFEGGEGAGKSTQIKKLAKSLGLMGIDVVMTREPGGCLEAEQIRRLLVTGSVSKWDPLSELFLFSAARREHIQKKIKPALDQGKWVLCDRFADSTMAYQGYAGKIGCPTVETINHLTIEGFAPDLTIIFDIPPDIGLNRASKRKNDENRFEQMNFVFHEMIREAFLKIAEGEPERCKIIDAAGGVRKVEQDILKIVQEKFGV